MLALITARGGSKRVPRKNVLPVGGRPLIAWTVAAARASVRVGRILVSTDDEEIAGVCRAWGAEVPFLRPASLAGDHASHLDTVRHALAWVRDHGGGLPEYCLLLQPTSPLRTAGDIDDFIDAALGCGAGSAVSVAQTPAHPYLAGRIDGSGRLVRFSPPPAGYLRSQDFPSAYVINGALYLTRCAAVFERETLLEENPLAYVMPAERSLDVDTPWDLHLADLILRGRHGVGDPLAPALPPAAS